MKHMTHYVHSLISAIIILFLQFNAEAQVKHRNTNSGQASRGPRSSDIKPAIFSYDSLDGFNEAEYFRNKFASIRDTDEAILPDFVTCNNTCVNFNNQPPAHNNLYGFHPDPTANSITLSISDQNSQGGTGDYYLMVQDEPGASVPLAGSQFNGPWCCGQFCYDYKIFYDAVSGATNIHPTFYIRRGTKVFRFESSIVVNENSPWVRVCAPVSNGATPPVTPDGTWFENTATTLPTDWSYVLANVEEISFYIDYSSALEERTGFDNFCLVPNPLQLNCTATNADCDVSNGTATVYPSAGTGTYTYAWNTVPPLTTQTITGLGAGTFCATVIDGVGCTESCCATVVQADCDPGTIDCFNCLTSFAPYEGKKYILSAWVKEIGNPNALTYTMPVVRLEFLIGTSIVQTIDFSPQLGDKIIDGWQRIEREFLVPNAEKIRVNLLNTCCTGNDSHDVLFDDIRIWPYDGSMKSFVYDPISLKLMAEMDEHNYATFYEYDEEGALVRVKKETERGIMTIKESRNNTKK